METLFSNERKIERALRSKCGLDAVFEMSQMAPWRETSCLETGAPDGQTTILLLDFKNFYPSILCAHKFPHPGKLRLVARPTPSDLERPGLCRCVLHPKTNMPQAVRNHHPFQIQTGIRSLPFLIEGRPIYALLHSAELPVWTRWFDAEIPEAILSEEAVRHPLAHRTIKALVALEAARAARAAGGAPDEAAKLAINLASTTPKIGSPANRPSPYGVHCLPSQIAGIGRAMLFHTAHEALRADPNNRLLMTNTDGFLLSTTNPRGTLQHLKAAGLCGPDPGQLREKARGDEAVILGPNLWWLLREGKIAASCGIGKNPEAVPLFHRFNRKGRTEKIATIHLADWRHSLDHHTLSRKKMRAPENFQDIGDMIALEKKRSFHRTLRSLRDLRNRTAPNL